jgi:hypothetical protein
MSGDPAMWFSCLVEAGYEVFSNSRILPPLQVLLQAEDLTVK